MSGKLTKLARFFALTISAGVMLSGCAGTGSVGGLDESTFFADPATFAMYDCKQLANARARAWSSASRNCGG